MRPKTQYVRSGDVNIAYQVLGEGPLDLVLVLGWITHLEWAWEDPGFTRLLEGLASFSRLILFDKRGTGLSDRLPEDSLPDLEQRMDDVRAVMDAVGSERAAIVGVSEGGPMSALFATTYPERTRALVMYGSYARWVRADDYPWAPPMAIHEKTIEAIRQRWGEPIGLEVFAPSVARDPRFREWFATGLRYGASPGAAIALLRMNVAIDIRRVLPAIRVPTLILHRKEDRMILAGGGRWMAEQIPDARYVELAGEDHLAWVGDTRALVGEIEEFLTGSRETSVPSSVLATVLFVDIVGSTQLAVELGDAGWRDRLESFYAVVRRQLERYRGREMDTAGDGLFAGFDGPARAIRCAVAIRDDVAKLDLTIRAGLHTGECQVIGDKLGGIAVQTGARVAASAEPGEILVSSTVRDLVAGSGLGFTDRGTHTLKGLPEARQLFRVDS